MLEDFYANFRMVVGKLLTAGTLISLGACAHHYQAYYGEETTADRTGSKNFWHKIMDKRADAYNIPIKDRDRHQRCVFFALDNLNLGETCKWVSPDSSARGEVKVVFVYPSGGKMCHVFFTQLDLPYTSKKWQDTACYSAVNNRWSFISKT